MNRAVINGVLQHVSPSQITTFSDCQRKWGFDKIEGLRPPDTGPTNLGTKIHGEHEAYYLDGTAPAYGSLARLIADSKWPARGPGLLIEFPKSYELGLFAAGVRVRGRIDLVVTRDPTTIEILDVKSTGSFTWSKTSEDLARNTQLITYAQWAFEQFPDARHVRVGHGYVLTSGTDHRVVLSEDLSRGQVASVYSHIEHTVAEMVVAAQAPKAADLRPNWDACHMYRGCPYGPDGLDVCPRAVLTTATPTLSLAERAAMARRAQGITPPDAALPDVPVPWTPTATPAPMSGESSGTGTVTADPVNPDAPAGGLVIDVVPGQT